MNPSKRGNVRSIARDLNVAASELIKQGKPVIKSHIGAPCTGAPPKALAMMKKAMNNNIMSYSAATGIDSLRERISQHYQDFYQVNVSPQRVIVTVGASGALTLSMITCFDVEQTICLPYPAYGAYRNVIELCGLKFEGLSCKPENHFLPTVEDLEALPTKVHGIILINPSNPTGCVMPADQFKKLIQYCLANDIKVISDEIYHGLIYSTPTECQTAQAFSDQVISINSFSKYFSMPGWRLGWMVAPENIVSQMACVMRSLLIAPPTPSQYAAIGALDSIELLNEHVVRYKKNRDILLEALPQAGFDRFSAPDGAFYFYVHVKYLSIDSLSFCKKMLQETYITASPGTEFDPLHGQHYVRFCYAGKTSEIEEMAERLITWRNHD